jgi:hypothetical protein
MTDFSIPATDRIDVDICMSGVRIVQDIDGDESIVWVHETQLKTLVDILSSILGDQFNDLAGCQLQQTTVSGPAPDSGLGL